MPPAVEDRDRPRRRRVRVSAGALIAGAGVAALLSGCGHAGHSGVCGSAARAAMARTLALSPGRVTLAASTGNNGMPQCILSARVTGTATVRAIANVDTAPQAYIRLERTAEEATQQFTTVRLVAPPQNIAGLGLDADWFPDPQQLMTTDGRRLITISISWPDATPARRQALARALARTYLAQRT